MNFLALSNLGVPRRAPNAAQAQRQAAQAQRQAEQQAQRAERQANQQANRAAAVAQRQATQAARQQQAAQAQRQGAQTTRQAERQATQAARRQAQAEKREQRQAVQQARKEARQAKKMKNGRNVTALPSESGKIDQLQAERDKLLRQRNELKAKVAAKRASRKLRGLGDDTMFTAPSVPVVTPPAITGPVASPPKGYDKRKARGNLRPIDIYYELSQQTQAQLTWLIQEIIQFQKEILALLAELGTPAETTTEEPPYDPYAYPPPEQYPYPVLPPYYDPNGYQDSGMQPIPTLIDSPYEQVYEHPGYNADALTMTPVADEMTVAPVELAPSEPFSGDSFYEDEQPVVSMPAVSNPAVVRRERQRQQMVPVVVEMEPEVDGEGALTFQNEEESFVDGGGDFFGE